MEKRHIFNYNVNKVFNAIEESVKAEVEDKTEVKYEELKGVSYKVNNMNYDIIECSVENGYILKVYEDDITSYTLNIAFNSLEDDKTELLYENVFSSSSKVKSLNYKISSFIFKKRINVRYNAFVNYIESVLKES